MTAVTRIRELLGGETVTGPLHNDLDMARLVRRGVPTQAVDHFLASTGLSLNALDPNVLTVRTFRRHQKNEQRLAKHESDRLLRLVGVVAAAHETFGDDEKARIWLKCESRALDGETPLGMIETGRGARAVEALLERIAHGIAA